MADFEIKRGDSWTPIGAVLSDTNGPIDLTDATAVRLNMRSTSAIVDGVRATVQVQTGPVTFVDRVAGSVSYQWDQETPGDTDGDLSFTGEYVCEFEIEWDTGDRQTVPNNGYFTIRIFDDIDPPVVGS